VTVSTGMLAYIPAVGSRLQEAVGGGGTGIGPGTLRLFFALHTALLPALIAALMTFHFWRIRKAGGLVVPATEGEEADPRRVSTVPHLLVRETTAALVVIASVMLLSIFFDAPLGEPANPGLSPSPTKAPWYFAGFQELLLHLHPVAAVFWLPLAGALWVAAIPYLTYSANSSGVWFVSAKGKRLAGTFAAAGFVSACVAVAAKESLLSAGPNAGAFDILASAAIPLVLASIYAVLRKRSANTNEAVQAVFTFAAAAFVALTLIGSLLRGEGMRLILLP
jgi:quinol-cytochrome oxidoreductase complex cytochrome b subunit